MATNAAQHKIINLLKTPWVFLWLCVAVSCKIDVYTLLLCVHMRGFSFMVVCSFQCVIFQGQTVELTPSDISYMCSWWLSKAAIINNISACYCGIRCLMLYLSQVSILIWLLKVTPHVGGASHIACHALQVASVLPCTGSQQGCGRGPRPCFLFSCQLIFIMKVNKAPYLLLFF